MSLQYHIYSSLSEDHSAKSLANVLGLTERQLSEIQKAVRLRSLNPASLGEIWGFCTASSVGSLTILEPPSFVDIDLFNEYLNYMIFASNYELAYQSEVRRAEGFLSSRSLPTDMLGVWVPDPSDLNETEHLTLSRFPELQGTPNMLTEQLNLDSGYSSSSETGQNIDISDDRRSLAGNVKKTGTGRRAQIRGQCHLSSDTCRKQQRGLRTALDVNPDLVVKSARHPLANVTTPGDLVRPPRGSGRNKDDAIDEFRPNSPASSQCRLIPVIDDTNLTQQDPKSRSKPTDHRSAGSMSLRARSTLKQPPAMVLSQEEARLLDAENDLNPPKGGISISDATTQLRVNPRRLVLKIQDQDGLARIFKKKPKSKEDLRLVRGLESRTATDYALERPSSIPVSNESGNARITAQAGAFESNESRNDKSADLDTAPDSAISAVHLLEDLSNTTNVSHKRKASRLDIDREHRYHTQAKHSSNGVSFGRGPTDDFGTPNKWCPSVSSTAIPTSTLDGEDNFITTSKVVSSRSPSYSPISENEGFEEFQTLFKRPGVRGPRVKPGRFSRGDAVDANGPTTPFTALNLDFQNRLRILSAGLDDANHSDARELGEEQNVQTGTRTAADKANTEDSPIVAGTKVKSPLRTKPPKVNPPARRRGPRGPYKKKNK